MAPDAFQIQTQRLLIREFQTSDAVDLYRLNSNPDVMRYTGEDPFADENTAAEFISAYSHYHDHGFGRWAVEEADSGKFMGFCGLRRRADSEEVDLAFRLFREYWAAGFATEAATACLQAGFESFGLNDIVGYAMRENLPSISVLQKLGMRFRQMAENRGTFWLVYGVSREVYQARA